jgi:hypothetical protein
MLFQYPVSDAQKIVADFESCTLAKIDWSHEAHLLAGMSLYFRYGNEAYKAMKTRVIRYNEAVGTANTEDSGYHATITLYWIWTIHIFCKKNKLTAFNQEAVDTLLESEALVQRNSFLEFYEKDTILSKEARREIVFPDRKEMEGLSFFFI